MAIRRGRPSLLRTTARTAVVAGTATAVAGKVAHGQQMKIAQQQAAAQQEAAQQQQMADMQAQLAELQTQQVSPTPPAAAGDSAPAATAPQQDRIAQLKDLAALKESGILTEAEFEAEKQRILGQ